MSAPAGKHGPLSVPTRSETRACPCLPFRDDIWFDDVDPEDIEAAIGPEAANIARKRLGQRKSSITLVKEQGFSGSVGHWGRWSAGWA